jgi:hypothetical protein
MNKRSKTLFPQSLCHVYEKEMGEDKEGNKQTQILDGDAIKKQSIL